MTDEINVHSLSSKELCNLKKKLDGLTRINKVLLDKITSSKKDGEKVGPDYGLISHLSSDERDEAQEPEHTLGNIDQKAQLIARSRAQFLSEIGHEIRTPLNSILGMAHLTLETRLTDEQRDYLNAIKLESERLMVFIGDVLEFLGIEAGSTTVTAESVNIRELFDQLKSLLSSQLEEKNIVFVDAVGSNCPKAVMTDKTRLNQILRTLLENAAKYTWPRGAVVFQTFTDGEKIHFVVSDTSAGIPPERLPFLFDPFDHQSFTEGLKRGGLELPLAHCLARLLGGELTCKSKELIGSAFILTLPLRAASIHTHHQTLSLQEEPNHFPSLRNTQVLLVEDNVINQKVAARLLENLGCTVTCVKNGREAVQEACCERTRPFDIILMDCQMPVLNGYDACRLIRQHQTEHPSQQHTRIIALTANAMKGDRELCLSAGMDDYLSKPFTLPQLAQALLKWAPSPRKS